MESVEELKQHLNRLKKTLILEREERKSSQKTIESLKQQVRTMEDSIAKTTEDIDKASKEKQKIDDELEKAEERLKTLSKTKTVAGKPSGSSQSILALEQQNEKLVEEYNALQRQNDLDEEKILKLKNELELSKKQLSKYDQEIQGISTNSDNKESDISTKAQKIKEEMSMTIKQKVRVNDKNHELSEEIEKLTRKCQRLSQDREALKEFISSKTELEESLERSVETHKKNESLLKNSLLQARYELLDANSYYKEFEVKVISLMIQCRGKLIIKKNHDGEYLVEIIYKGKCESVPLRQIEDIFEHPSKENRIVLKYKNKAKDIVSEEKEKIIGILRGLMERGF